MGLGPGAGFSFLSQKKCDTRTDGPISPLRAGTPKWWENPEFFVTYQRWYQINKTFSKRKVISKKI
mgnify:CR=1 FL=1